MSKIGQAEGGRTGTRDRPREEEASKDGVERERERERRETEGGGANSAAPILDSRGMPRVLHTQKTGRANALAPSINSHGLPIWGACASCGQGHVPCQCQERGKNDDDTADAEPPAIGHGTVDPRHGSASFLPG